DDRYRNAPHHFMEHSENQSYDAIRYNEYESGLNNSMGHSAYENLSHESVEDDRYRNAPHHFMEHSENQSYDAIRYNEYESESNSSMGCQGTYDSLSHEFVEDDRYRNAPHHFMEHSENQSYDAIRYNEYESRLNNSMGHSAYENLSHESVEDGRYRNTPHHSMEHSENQSYDAIRYNEYESGSNSSMGCQDTYDSPSHESVED
ncbi:hypothetical protein, partial [Bacillus cereus group sp. BfR-BA-01349]|uniref:hypothetical protein n=1 Tax=Bacillus cereus group sp. BfR-BA-01349 TaxID=2920312 RepID=UPI001F5ABE3E